MKIRRFLQVFSRSDQSGIGGKGEDVAARFLQRQGFTLVEHNWKNSSGRRIGEVDLICYDDRELVFVEVKSRTKKTATDTVLPEEQISAKKLQKLARIAEHYISHHELWDTNYRFDAVSIVYSAGSTVPDIRHIKNIYL